MGRQRTKLDGKGLELLVLIAYRFDQISIGRARELLGWSDAKIRDQAPKRVGRTMTCEKCGEGVPVPTMCPSCRPDEPYKGMVRCPRS